MDRATLSQRIESILNEITRLSNTLYAMDNTNIQRHSDNYEMLSTEAALRGEVIACRLRHLIYETTTIRKAEYLTSAGVMQGISVICRCSSSATSMILNGNSCGCATAPPPYHHLERFVCQLAFARRWSLSSISLAPARRILSSPE